jgi:hypothetical protein
MTKRETLAVKGKFRPVGNLIQQVHPGKHKAQVSLNQTIMKEQGKRTVSLHKSDS